MRGGKLILLIAFFSVEVSVAQNFPDSLGIGGQQWTVANLTSTRFANGDSIANAQSDAAWVAAINDKKPAWCYYENNPMNANRYGILYNYYAITDPRGLVSKSWHIPTSADLENLITFLGGQKVAGNEMKTDQYWDHTGGLDRNGTNLSGFSIIPSGMRSADGRFMNKGKGCYLWATSTVSEEGAKVYVYHFKYTGGIIVDEANVKAGYSVRCIRDKL